MSLLKKIQRGKQPLPPRLILYGTEGIGKSTFASEAPAPVFVSTVKVRNAGFTQAWNTEESFCDWLQDLMERKILPPK